MRHYQKDKNKIFLYPKDIKSKLEFDKIQELLLEKCSSPLGQAYVNRMQMTSEADKIQTLLQQVHEFKQLEMFEEQSFPIENYLDVSAEVKYLNIANSVLNEQQVFRIYRVLISTNKILQYFKGGSNNEKPETYPAIFQLIKELSINKPLINAIKDVLTEEGYVRSDASKELVRIRRAITSLHRDIERKFNALLGEYKRNGWLTDTSESVRGGRRVLSVTAEHKRKIKGIIHDVSSTGSTTFIEPDATLQINNEIVEFQQAERQEIYRILKELTNRIRPHTETIQQYQRLLGLFDFIRAKALVAIDTNSFMPRLSNDKSVEIFNARHPLLFIKNKALKKDVVPLSFSLSIAERILLVSGPNAGGKSVMLKTVGLMQMMLQTGMLVPCNDNSIMSIYNKIFVDMGDEQSIENDLSTYSSRLKNMRYFTEHANAKTLILIDEFGSGTDPSLGGPIAEAILEYTNKKFCYGIITTHYSNLKVFATNTKGIFNGCMTFDHRNLAPQYKLDVGKPGSSFAFELASKSGLNKQIIEAAKSKVDRDYKEFDELLTSMQKEKQSIVERERKAAKREKELSDLLASYNVKKESLEKERKKILLETQEKAHAYLSDANKRFENMVREWNENRGEKKIIKKIKTEIEQDKNKLSQSIEEIKDKIFYRTSERPVAVGASVRLHDGKEVGEVLEIRNNTAIVQFDILKTHIKVKKLLVVEKVEEKKSDYQPGYTSYYNTMEARSEFESNIDIRGMRRDEALRTIEEWIDKAIVFNMEEVKIIHGIGDGILRRSIRDMLRRVRAVKAVHDEDPQYGGQGVSIVELQ